MTKKVILITGTSTGFGALMVKTFSKAGYTVIATMRDVKGKNAKSAAELATLPATEVVDLDVTDEASVKKAVEEVHAKHKKIDVLINNAGIYGAGVLEGYTTTQLQKLFDVNVWGVIRVNNAVLPAMRQAGDGLIITISSVVGLFSMPLQSAYNATKFAVEGFIEGSYAELFTQGVESVLIEPGGFPTEIISKPPVTPDRAGISESYGQPLVVLQTKLQEAFGKIFTENVPDSQLVADAALTLVKTEKGKRPLRTSVDPNSKGIDTEFVTKTEEIKKRWVAVFGV